MKKTINTSLTLMTAGMLCLASTPAAEAAATSDELEQLKQQVQMLTQQNQQLNQRLTEMETTVSGSKAVTETEAPAAKADAAAGEKEEGGLKIGEMLTLSGSIEGDFIVAEDFAGNSSSEFNLDTVELILDLKASEWAKGKIVIDYDGDDEDLYIDEANITLGGNEAFPLFLTAGKIYAPFGDFSTNMIQDPFTQTLGEINEEGAIAGFEKNGFTASVFAYNGVDEVGDDSTVNGYGASIAYAYEQDDLTLRGGAGWVSNLADADGIADMLPRSEDDDIVLHDATTGLNLFAGAQYKGVSLFSEYTTALDSFQTGDLSFASGGAEPKAWNTELAYTTALAGKETVFALGYQKTWESLGLELPEYRYSVSGAMGIFEGTTVILEYYYDEDYTVEDGGTDGNGYGFTTRLAYEF